MLEHHSVLRLVALYCSIGQAAGHIGVRIEGAVLVPLQQGGSIGPGGVLQTLALGVELAHISRKHCRNPVCKQPCRVLIQFIAVLFRLGLLLFRSKHALFEDVGDFFQADTHRVLALYPFKIVAGQGHCGLAVHLGVIVLIRKSPC